VTMSSITTAMPKYLANFFTVGSFVGLS